MNKHSHRLVFSRSRGCCVAVAETVVSSGKSASGEKRGGRATPSIATGIGLAIAVFGAQAQGLPGGAALIGIAPRTGIVAPAIVAPASTTSIASVLPTGGTIVKGAGSISVSGTTMTVDQTTQRLISDWQSFSIGSGDTVRFVQPSSSSVALNRVIGDDASAIFGSLTANGHVYLQNANGVYFAPGAQISVGSLLATTLEVDPDQFMLGKVRLSGGSEASGSVVNDGSIVTSAGGTVVLAGPVVTNAGSITTPGGTTALVAGNAVNVDPTGSGLLSISVPAAAVNARLVQSGTITADGGAVQLAAAATDAALRTVMQIDGVVRARSIENHGGQITLSGGSSGMVIVDGELDASGVKGAGGTIEVLGDRVGLVGTAHLDASGATGGGTVLVGGNRHGEGTEQNATNTYVGSGTVIDASATGTGDGGKVVVWSEGTTTYSGQIDARGGVGGGNGGQVEVSGKGTLNFDGGVGLLAPKGAKGDLLLDPDSIVIGTVANVDGTPNHDLVGNTLTAIQYSGATSYITASNVANLLATTNVTLAAQSSISVTAPVTVAAGGSPSTLSLTAPTISTSSPLTLNNASLVATGSSVTVGSAITSSASVTLQAGYTALFAPITAANLTLLSGSLSTNTINNGTGSGTLSVGTLTIGAGTGFGRPDDANLGGTQNKVGTLNANVGSLFLTVTNDPGVPLVISGQYGNSLSLAATNTSVTQGALPGNAVTSSGTTNITTTGSGDITLTNPANQFVARTTFTGAGNVSFYSTGGLTASGSATGDVDLETNGVFSLPYGSTLSGHDINTVSAGFQTYYGNLSVAPGGRFTIHSSDYTRDTLYGLTDGTGAGQINFVVYGGYTGAAPSTGNGYFTNETGSLAVNNTTDASPVSKVYDGTTAFNYTQSGTSGSSTVNTISGPATLEPLSSYTVVTTGNFTDKNAGTNKGNTIAATNNTVAVGATSGATFYGLNDPGFTRAPGPVLRGQPGNAVSQITPKPITSTGVDGVDRVYNGSTSVGVAVAGATLVGVIAGDTVGLSATGATGTMPNKNVGVDKPIVVTGLSLTGTDAGNYTVTDASSAANVTISQLGITSQGIVAVNRVYDGTTLVAVNGTGATLTGVLYGDTVGVVTTGATGSVANKNVGTNKAVTVVGVGLSGTDAGNYSVVDASGATVAITPKPITSTGVDGIDRIYNGTTTVGVDVGGASLVGVVGGDTVGLSATGATGTMTNKNVGVDKPIVVTGLSLTGTDAGNYTVTDASSAANVTISQLGITSHGIVAVNRVYDGTTLVAVNGGGATLTGVISGDTVGVVTTGATGSVTDKNVGTNKPVTVVGVGLTGTDAGNYTVVDASGATVAITPKTISATGIDGVDRVYNGSTVVGVNATGAGLTGTIAGDTVSLVTTGATGTLGDKNVGTDKPVAVGGLTLGGADAGDYTLGAVTGATATITPKAITSTGFTGDNRVYDGTTTVGVNGSGATLVGVVGGDTVTVNAAGATGTIGDKNVGVGKTVTVGGVALGGADAADYTVTDASTATVTIAPRPITSTGIEGVDRTYNGTTTVAVSASGASLNNTISGDNISLVTTTATGTMTDKNAGSNKPVTVTGLGLGGTDAGNYTLTDASNATVNIAQLVISSTGITASNRVYNGGTGVALNTSDAGVVGVLAGDTVGVDASAAVGSVASPDPGAAKAVFVTGITLTGPDAINYAVSTTSLTAAGTPLTVRILTVDDGRFDELRYKEYLQALADAQEPFRRAMLEALLSGFGKENIRKQLQRGLVFETGLAPPAVDIIEPAKAPGSCTPAAGANLSCGH